MHSVMRVDAPHRLLRIDDAIEEFSYGLFAFIAGVMAVGGIVALVPSIIGHVPVGVALASAWVLAWLASIVVVMRLRRAVRRWHVPIRIRHGIYLIRSGHEAYRKLTPETRAAYGLPLVNSLYRLADTDVHGDLAIGKVQAAMRSRVNALNSLIDAEDKQRLYAAAPSLDDTDDLSAAALFQQAIDEADAELRAFDVLTAPGVRRPPPNPMPGDPHRQ